MTCGSARKPITLDDHAGRYLQRRIGLTAFPPCLRYAPDERYVRATVRPILAPDDGCQGGPLRRSRGRGERAALHRTYLDRYSGKADVAEPRKMLGSMPTGAAVRLMQHDDVLGIAEGIETALSASILFNVPCWAALTAGLLETVVAASRRETVFVFGDNDASTTGQAAAYTLAQKAQGEGRRCIVEIPTRTGDDWADVLATAT